MPVVTAAEMERDKELAAAAAMIVVAASRSDSASLDATGRTSL